MIKIMIKILLRPFQIVWGILQEIWQGLKYPPNSIALTFAFLAALIQRGQEENNTWGDLIIFIFFWYVIFLLPAGLGYLRGKKTTTGAKKHDLNEE